MLNWKVNGDYKCAECGKPLDWCWDGVEPPDYPYLCSTCTEIADDLLKKRVGHSIDEELVRNWKREDHDEEKRSVKLRRP